MVLNIPDNILHGAGLGQREVLLELACALYESEKLALWPAAQLAGMERAEFEEELVRRKIPVYRLDEAGLANDLEAMCRVGKLS